MHQPRVGFVTCVHPFYDLPAVAAHRESAVAELRKLGCVAIPYTIPRTAAEADGIGARLTEDAVDLVLLFFCTWVSEDVTLALARSIGDIPLFLWALPYLDLDVPMPSPMSGLTASGSNIRRAGKRFAWVVGGVELAIVGQVARGARVAAAVRALSRARMGIVGEACPGMADGAVDEAEVRRALGVTIVRFELNDLVDAAQAAPGDEAEQAARRLLAAAGGASDVSADSLAANLRFYVALRELARAHRLDGYCVRCWPELRNGLGVTPCAAHALMAGDGVASSCEVDLPALITTWLLGRLADASAFNFDITAFVADRSALQFAHCGTADPSLAGDPAAVRIRTHMRTGTGATVEFPFREGTVTLAKLLRPADGRFRLFAATGRAISSEGIRGSVATVQPDPSAGAFLAAMMRHAVEHHVALVYGAWMPELELFCEFTGVELLSPSAAACP